jgi:hypothetical protein
MSLSLLAASTRRAFMVRAAAPVAGAALASPLPAAAAAVDVRGKIRFGDESIMAPWPV